MENDKRIRIKPFPDKKTSFCGFHILETCRCCGVQNDRMHVLRMDNVRDSIRMVFCDDCMNNLFEEAGRELHKSVRLNDEVWELILCDDGKWHIFPMIVKNVCMYGSVRQLKDGSFTVWNIYAESENGYTYMYKSFYDAGKTLFFTEEDAKATLEEKEKEAAQCQNNTQ